MATAVLALGGIVAVAGTLILRPALSLPPSAAAAFGKASGGQAEAPLPARRESCAGFEGDGSATTTRSPLPFPTAMRQ
jgi:hypothetical protein